MNKKYLAAWLQRAAPPEMPLVQRRRTLLRMASALAVSAIAAPLASCATRATPHFASDPYTLGIASGCPRPDSVVLWTRLAPAAESLPPENIEVTWEVARDDKFRDIARRGTVLATPGLAHSVRAEATGLETARTYWYRFTAGDAVSATGRTRTAAAAGAVNERLRFAFASCQQYEQGYFGAYRHMAREDLDLVVFLGDYIYESSWGRAHVRKHEAAA